MRDTWGGSHIALLNTELVINSGIRRQHPGLGQLDTPLDQPILFADFGSRTRRTGSSRRDYSNGAIDASLSDGFTSLTKNRVRSDAGSHRLVRRGLPHRTRLAPQRVAFGEPGGALHEAVLI